MTTILPNKRLRKMVRTGTAGGGSSVTEPLAKVTAEEDRDEAGPTKASDISDMRELGYFY